MLKEKILTVINVAKTVFKGGDDSAKKELEKATRSTLTLLKELHRAFEDHANDDSPHDELLDDETIAREASPEPRDKSPSPSPNSSLDKRSSPRDQPVAASEAKVPVPPPAAGSTSAVRILLLVLCILFAHQYNNHRQSPPLMCFLQKTHPSNCKRNFPAEIQRRYLKCKNS